MKTIDKSSINHENFRNCREIWYVETQFNLASEFHFIFIVKYHSNRACVMFCLKKKAD